MFNFNKSALNAFKRFLCVFVAMVVLSVFQIQTVHAQNVKTYVHPNAYKLAPVYKSELEQHFANIPMPWYVLGLTEHESCQTLKHPRCFSPTSSFTTKWKDGTRREQGAGLSMITRAWKPDGSVRMDTLTMLRRAYPVQLKELTWDNISQRPDLQIRAMTLLLKSDYIGLREVKDPIERLKMTDSAYNGGRGDVNKARKVCGLTTGCNPQLWFGHVERHCVKSKKILYANRSACDINIHHVRDVFETRAPKYQPILPELSQ